MAKYLFAKSFLVSISLLLLTGCATPLEAPSGHKALVEGQTTYEELRQKYGKPRVESKGSAGQRLVTFAEAKMQPSTSALWLGRWAKNQGQLGIRSLDVLVDPNGVVKKYLYSDTGLPVRSKNFRMEVGAAVEPDKLRQIVKGQTTQSELARLIEAPGEKRLNLDGDLVMVWAYGKASHIHRSNEILQVVIGPDDKVKDFAVVSSGR